MDLYLLLLCNALILFNNFNNINCYSKNDSCHLDTYGKGYCVSKRDCQKVTSFGDDSLISHCGTDGRICCPSICLTASGNVGICVKSNSCSHTTNVTLKRCKIGNKKKGVCCAPEREEPLPPQETTCGCGIQVSVKDRIYGGEPLKIDEAPWLVLLMSRYVLLEYTVTECGGSLISDQYVLTAAHCLRGVFDNAKYPVPHAVILGDYNVTNSGADCVVISRDNKTGEDWCDCTLGTTTIKLESIIPHSGYRINEFHHDIGLLKLKEKAPYTDFIRPICLPSNDINGMKSPGQLRLDAAGWGLTETEIYSSIKKHVQLPFQPVEICNGIYTFLKSNKKEYICAGGEEGKDTCYGDSGGPLTYFNRNKFELVGITSSGVGCGKNDVPALYVNVYQFLVWIRAHMKN